MRVKRTNRFPATGKPWYASRLIMVGVAAVVAAVSDGLINNWGWRQIVAAVLGAIVVSLRIETDKAVTK